MFSFPPDLDIGFSCAQTKVFVKRNGTAGPLKEVKLPPHSKLCDLFEKSGKVLDIENAQKAFYSSGVECTDIEHIEEDEVIHISCGEPFKLAEGAGAAALQVVGNYILHEQLGQGGFGSVIKGVHSETGDVAAIKFVAKKSFRQFSDLQRVFQEIQALRNMRHPNIIRILDVADNPDSICFIMEFAAGGELRGYVEKRQSLSEEESRVFFKQIVRAVHYIHSKKIIHRDLKLENILLDKENRCKIVDFGLSDYVSSKERTVTDAGTEAYLAPEVYNGWSGHADPFKIDAWALGVILFAMTHGKLPFSRPDNDTCAMLDKADLHFSEGSTQSLCHIVKAMLTPAPEKRASVNEITLDPWVTMNRFAALVGELAPEDNSDSENSTAAQGSRRDQRLQSESRERRRERRRSATMPAMPEGNASNSAAAAVAAAAVASSRGERSGVERETRGEARSVLEHPREAPGAAGRLAGISPRPAMDRHIFDSRGSEHGSEHRHAQPSPRPHDRGARKDRLLPSVGPGRGVAGGQGGAGSSYRSGVSPTPGTRAPGNRHHTYR